jgi:hypothetical protein
MRAQMQMDSMSTVPSAARTIGTPCGRVTLSAPTLAKGSQTPAPSRFQGDERSAGAPRSRDR